MKIQVRFTHPTRHKENGHAATFEFFIAWRSPSAVRRSAFVWRWPRWPAARPSTVEPGGGSGASSAAADSGQQESVAAPTASGPSQPPGEKPATGREVLRRMTAAYQNASSYADKGKIRLVAEAGEQKLVDQSSDFSVAMVRPNKLCVVAYQAMMTCDGRKIRAAAFKMCPDQVLVKDAPAKLSASVITIDPNFAGALGDFGSTTPVVSAVNQKPDERVLASRGPGAGAAGAGRDRRPRLLSRSDYLALRIGRVLDRSADLCSQADGQRHRRAAQPVGARSADRQAVAGGRVYRGVVGWQGRSRRVEFPVPEGAQLVDLLVPRDTAKLLGKQAPAFKVQDLDGKPVTPQTLAGRVAVLVFWTSNVNRFEQSMEMLRSVETVRQPVQKNPNLAFYAVCIDPQQIKTGDLVKEIEKADVRMPVLRDTEQSFGVFNPADIPMLVVLDAKGTVQHFEVGHKPRLAEELPRKLMRVLSGKDIYHELQKEYLERVERFRAEARAQNVPDETAPPPPESPPAPAGRPRTTVHEVPLPATKIAPPSARTLEAQLALEVYGTEIAGQHPRVAATRECHWLCQCPARSATGRAGATPAGRRERPVDRRSGARRQADRGPSLGPGGRRVHRPSAGRRGRRREAVRRRLPLDASSGVT